MRKFTLIRGQLHLQETQLLVERKNVKGTRSFTHNPPSRGPQMSEKTMPDV
jgi:hypothetical protein